MACVQCHYNFTPVSTELDGGQEFASILLSELSPVVSFKEIKTTLLVSLWCFISRDNRNRCLVNKIGIVLPSCIIITCSFNLLEILLTILVPLKF